MRAVLSILIFCTYGIHRAVGHIVMFLPQTCCTRNIFYSERVSSGRLLVDTGSLDISLDDLLPAQSQKYINKSKMWRCLHNNNAETELRCAHRIENITLTRCCTVR